MIDLRPRLQAALGDAYALDRELGGGGMSRVFLATEASLHRQVVIKVLPPELASEVSQARFKQEIELAAHLQHTNILTVLSAGAKDDLLFYVMPFVTGESLRHRLTREGKLPVADAVRILHEIADALSYAHAEGVIHRDIKPENILLLGNHAVLTDFGVARALAEARSGERLTETGMSVGTPGYMSPEQAAGERHVDARADVYALAVVGYEMLAGAPPFEGPTAQAVLAAHLTETPKPVVELRPETPAAVSAALAKALAKDPAQRLHTAAELRDAVGTPGTMAAPRRGMRLAVGLTIGAALIAVGAAVVARSRSRPALDPDLVAVAPFDVLDPQLQLWKEGLLDLLARNLDGAGALRTVSPTIVVRGWSGRADPASAQELGRRTGARVTVFGTLFRTGGDSVRLAATVLDVASGKTLTQLERRDLVDRIDRLADSVTVALLLELGRVNSARGLRLSSLGSRSLAAMKAFLQGEQFLRRTTWDSALVYYERAIQLDTGFALALRRRGLAAAWQRSGFDSLSIASSLQAGAFNHGLAPRESLLVAADSLQAALWSLGADSLWWTHRRRLFATLDESTRRYPNDPEVWYAMGEAIDHFGPWAGAPESELSHRILDAFDRAIALDSAFAPAYLHPAEVGLHVGGSTLARRYTTAYLALHPTGEYADAMLLTDRLLDPTGASSPDTRRLIDSASAGVLVAAYFNIRRWQDSAESVVRLARALQRAAGRPGIPTNEARGHRNRLATALAMRGHVREAATVSDLAPDLYAELALLGVVSPDSASHVFSEWTHTDGPATAQPLPWWAAQRDTDAIKSFARRAETNARSARGELQQSGWRYLSGTAQGFLALARGDSAEALQRLLATPDSLCFQCPMIRLTEARLLQAQGRDREAAALLDEPPQHLGFAARPSGGLWALERGRVNERLGNREKAAQAYGFVVDLWRNADPELQPYVAEARAALARLGGERSR